MCTLTSVAEGLSVRGKMVSASSVTSENCSGVKKCKKLEFAALSAVVAGFLSGVCSEQPDKIALAKDADIALPVIQAVYLRASRLFMGGLPMLVAASLLGDWAIP